MAKKVEKIKKACNYIFYDNIHVRDIYYPCSFTVKKKGPETRKEVQYRMKKYELALVVSVNVDDEVRNATIEQVKELITRFGGTVTDPGTCEKKKLCI